jgi:uncharacterized membrane protein
MIGLGGVVRAVPDLRRRTVLAATPWMILGGVLHALALAGAYDGPAAAAFASTLVVPATGVLAATAWVPLVQVGRLRTRADPAGYLGATGAGALVPLLVVTLLAGRATVATLAPLVLTPVLGGLAAAGVIFGLGLSAAPALAATRSLGLLAVYAQVFHGVVVVVAVDALGASPTGSVAVPAVGLGARLSLGVGTAWLFLLLTMFGAALLVAGLGRVAERHPPVAYILLGAIAAAGIGPGVATLLSVTVLA